MLVEQDRSAPPYPSVRRAWYTVGVLTFAYIFSFIDRQILSLLVAPIRRDLQITDTQMSLLMGLSFAIFYTVLGFPIGRLADSRSRRDIIVTGILVWSLFTAGCGFVGSFLAMFLMRMGVGVGEAALSPAAYSMMADLFPPDRRALAISVYGSGIYIGSGLALILGGLVSSYTTAAGVFTLPLLGVAIHPWQAVFLVVGLPGLLVAASALTTREPVRRETSRRRAIPLRDVARYIFDNRSTFALHHFATAMIALAGYATLAWFPTLLMRTYGWPPARTGAFLGITVGVCGTLGILAGGFVSDRLLARGYRDAPLRVGFVSSLFGVFAAAIFPLMPSGEWALAFGAPCVFLNSSLFGVAPAALQQAVPPAMRAQVSAMYLFVVNLVGMGLGPTSVAILTDRFFHDDSMLRYSLLISCSTACLVAAILWALALKPYRRTLDQCGAASASLSG